jgi:hypothetical protein
MPNWLHWCAKAMLVNMLLKWRNTTESRTCGELAIKANRAVVFPSNFCEPMVKRKDEAVAQGVIGILPTANKTSMLKGTPNPLCVLVSLQYTLIDRNCITRTSEPFASVCLLLNRSGGFSPSRDRHTVGPISRHDRPVRALMYALGGQSARRIQPWSRYSSHESIRPEPLRTTRRRRR